MSSPKRLQIEALCAEPFANLRSTGPADGMEKSYQEIQWLLDLLEMPSEGFVFRGSPAFLPDDDSPQPNDAALDLIQRPLARFDQPLCLGSLGPTDWTTTRGQRCCGTLPP
jgi:hypothetical protein